MQQHCFQELPRVGLSQLSQKGDIRLQVLEVWTLGPGWLGPLDRRQVFMWGWGPERWAVSCSPSVYGERGHEGAERGCWESNVGAQCCEAWTSSHNLALELLSQHPSQSPRLRSFKSLICHGLEPPAPWPWVMASDLARVPCTLETSLPPSPWGVSPPSSQPQG